MRTFTTIHVLLNSPACRQPWLSVPHGLRMPSTSSNGLDNEPGKGISRVLPKPLGSVWKPPLEHTFTACAQSLATTGGATALMLKVPGQGLAGLGPQVSMMIQY